MHDTFRIGDIVSFTTSEHLSLFAIVVGGSFLGPPGFTGVLHVYTNQQVLAILPESIYKVHSEGAGKEVEYI